MPVPAPPARFAAAALSLAAALGAGRARAQPVPGAQPVPAAQPVPVAQPVPAAQPVPGVPPPPEPVVLPSPPDPVTLDVGVRLGGAFRSGSAPAFSVGTRTGFMMGAGVAIAPSPRFAIGVAYERSGLGSEHGQGDLGIVDVERSLDSLWATLRLSLVRFERVSIGVTLGPGLVWQHAQANVLLYGGTAGRPDVYTCADSGGPGLGLRAGVGAEVRLAGGFYFSLDATADELRLSSDPLGTCAPGAGSTALFGVRGGLSYRFDLTRNLR